jgi:hypothetical protein
VVVHGGVVRDADARRTQEAGHVGSRPPSGVVIVGAAGLLCAGAGRRKRGQQD